VKKTTFVILYIYICKNAVMKVKKLQNASKPYPSMPSRVTFFSKALVTKLKIWLPT